MVNQLTRSVYDRLMLSMGGVLSFNQLAKDPSNEDVAMTLIDMLFTGLNRSGSFNFEPIHIYDTSSYYVVTGFLFVYLYIVFITLYSTKMNQETALKERLQMFHFSFEKLTIVRGIIAWFYSLIWAFIGFIWITHALNAPFENTIGQR